MIASKEQHREARGEHHLTTFQASWAEVRLEGQEPPELLSISGADALSAEVTKLDLPEVLACFGTDALKPAHKTVCSTCACRFELV